MTNPLCVKCQGTGKTFTEPVPGRHNGRWRTCGCNETVVISVDDVTDEILEMAESVTDGWFLDGPIDWESVWDRMEGTDLRDGTVLSMGDQFGTPAMRKIQRHVRKVRSEG